jgi:Mn-dependent DtxR family transcriptional regulator
MKYRESEETYLETIYVLKQSKDDLHATDIASELNFSKPSVSRALGLLEKKGFITRTESGKIDLTIEGLQKASGIFERHSVITRLLIKVGADESLAEDNACRIEHVICPELFEVLKKFVEQK